MEPKIFNNKFNHHLSSESILYPMEPKKGTAGYLFFVFAFALIYGGVLTLLPLDIFKDRDNYLRYAGSSWILLEYYWTISPLTVLANEPLWLLINSGLAKVFLPETVLRLIIFFPASLVAWTVLRQDSRHVIFLFFFLLIPQVIVHHICMLRQGLAISIFLTGWFCHRKFIRLLLIAVTPFIHASYFFVVALFMVTLVARRLRLGGDLRTMLFVVVSLVVGGTLGWVAVFFGARQADTYDFVMGKVSGLGFVFWGMVLIVMGLQGRMFARRYIFELGVIIFYLTTYFTTELTARIFESTLLLVLLAGLHLTRWRRVIFLTLVFCYGLLQYALRMHEPWLGFGLL